MIEFAQSSLVSLVAGAVIASSLLAFGAYEGAAARDLSIQGALDALALSIAGAHCDAGHPLAAVELAENLAPVRGDLDSLLLFDDHLQARGTDGAAHVSIAFPSLGIRTPLDLTGRASLDLRFDRELERCTAAAA